MDRTISYGSRALTGLGGAFSLPFRGGGRRATGGWGLRRPAQSPRWALCPVPGGPGSCPVRVRQPWRQLLRSLMSVTMDIACLMSYYALRFLYVSDCHSVSPDRRGRCYLRHAERSSTTSGTTGGRQFYDIWNAPGPFYDNWNFYDKWNGFRYGTALAACCVADSSFSCAAGKMHGANYTTCGIKSF